MNQFGDDRFRLTVAVKWELILFLLLFGLAVFLRFYCLSADPPEGLSLSAGIETDPAAHTGYARNTVLTGEWNPYHDNRFITYQFSLISGSAWIVYEILGVGVYQTNLVSVLISLLAIFLFYLVLRKPLGNGVALLALFFMGINYIGIFIGRRPLLENGMNLLFIAGLFSLVYGERRIYGHFLFGAMIAAAIVFGKIIALAFLGVPVVYYWYRKFIIKADDAKSHMLAAAFGFILTAGAWYLLVFMPYSSSVAGYMKEQVFGLHGSPEALISPSHLLWKYLVFGIKSAFFDRMPAISMAGLAMVIILCGRIFRKRFGDHVRLLGNPILILLAVWLVGTYLGEMPWNYQPLRYLTAMIYPLAALTAALIAFLINAQKPVNIANRSPVFGLVFLALLLLLIYQLLRAVVVSRGEEFHFQGYIGIVTAITLIVFLICFLPVWFKKTIKIRLTGVFRYLLISVIIVISIYYQAANYITWAKVPLYTARQASIDTGMNLTPKALLFGPYGPALAVETDLGAMINFFGTTRPDPGLLRRYPITHLALDFANEEEARRLYPEVMQKAVLISNYNINGDKVTVYYVAPFTGNARAAQYAPSLYEQASLNYAAGRPDSGQYYLNRFLEIYPENISGNTIAGILARNTGNLDRAVQFFSRAVEFSPTDFFLHFLLGNAYIDLAGKTGRDDLRKLGEAEMLLAQKYSVGNFNLDED